MMAWGAGPRAWGSPALIAAIAAALIGGALVAPRATSAHALLRRSDPEGGTALQRAPAIITLTFTEQPEPALSIVHVLDGAGKPVEQGPALVAAGDPLQLRVLLPPLPQGVYTVSWRTVSRGDGHVTGGAFAFGVGMAPSPAQAAQAATPPPTPLSVAARWALYAGLAGLLGAAWVWTLTMSGSHEGFVWSPAFLWIVWALAAGGVAGLGTDQAAGAGVTIARLFETPLGGALWKRAIPIAASGAAIVLGQVLPHRRRTLLGVIGAGALAAMLAQVLGGHAAAGGGPWRLGNIADQWVHFAAVGTWIGGLAALLVAVRGTPDAGKAEAVRRFSFVAGIAIAVLAATGVLRAVDEVGTWGALLSTDFGRVVLNKAVLLLMLAALGAVNRFRSVPAAGRTLVGLRRVGSVEVALAALVLMAAGFLTGLAPPSLTPKAAAGVTGLHVSGSDFATSVRVRMDISPGLPGMNQFVARVVDYDTGRPIAARRVGLRFDRPDRPDIGSSTLELTRRPDGAFDGSGGNLSFEGAWNVAMTVEEAATATTVPLTVTMPSPPLTVRTITAPGQPTLYSIDLPGNRVLDAYLDPGRPGFNEFHATFINATGGELPIPRPATMTAARPGTPPHPLPVRRFGPGHFIADARLGPGDWRLEVIASTAEGEVLRAHLMVHL